MLITNYTKKVIKSRFIKNYDEYEKASNITNVPICLLASIHFRENSMLSSTYSNSGPMQFDPPLTNDKMFELLKIYTKLDLIEIEELVNKGIKDFYTSLCLAGCFLQDKFFKYSKKLINKKFNTIDNDLDLKLIMMLYNGLYKDVSNSPYVMNMYDEQHKFMKLTGTIVNNLGVNEKIEITDKRPGSFVVMKFLEEEFKDKINESLLKQEDEQYINFKITIKEFNIINNLLENALLNAKKHIYYNQQKIMLENLLSKINNK